MNDKVYNCIIKTIEEFNDELDKKIDISEGRETELFGGKSVLDSLGLVNLIVSVEENIADEFDKNITITSEKAMSRKVSPFLNIGTLTDYVTELLNEEN